MNKVIVDLFHSPKPTCPRLECSEELTDEDGKLVRQVMTNVMWSIVSLSSVKTINMAVIGLVYWDN